MGADVEKSLGTSGVRFDGLVRQACGHGQADSDASKERRAGLALDARPSTKTSRSVTVSDPADEDEPRGLGFMRQA